MYIMIEMFPFSQLVYKLMILQPLTSNNTMYGDTNVVGDYMGGEGRGKEGKGEGVSLRNLILLVASSSLTAVVASLFIQYLATCYMMKEVVCRGRLEPLQHQLNSGELLFTHYSISHSTNALVIHVGD